MTNKPRDLLREEYDFSTLAGPTEEKVKRRDSVDIARQEAALAWELDRELGREKTGWLNLPAEKQQQLVEAAKNKVPLSRAFPVLRPGVREISPEELRKHQSEIKGEIGEVGKDPIFPIETVLIVAVQMDRPSRDLGLAFEQLVGKRRGRKKKRRQDAMSDLWAIAAWRLREAGNDLATIAAILNSIPAFTEKRAYFDAESAKKLVKEAKQLIRDRALDVGEVWRNYRRFKTQRHEDRVLADDLAAAETRRIIVRKGKE